MIVEPDVVFGLDLLLPELLLKFKQIQCHGAVILLSSRLPIDQMLYLLHQQGLALRSLLLD